MSDISIYSLVILLGLAFIQNVSFTIVSRARNRDKMTYHAIASVFSNGIWFLTFSILVKENMNLIMFVPYCIGTVSGSLWGAKVAMYIEAKIGAKT